MSQPAYLDEKSEGNHSMPVKQETGEAFTPMYVLQDLRTMVKATRLKSSSQGCPHHPSVRMLDNDVIQCSPCQPLGLRSIPVQSNFRRMTTVKTMTGKRTNGLPTVRYYGEM